ncbi:MAG: DNA recombination protein RmuC [Gammaproteobacteria bacterium]
MIGFDSSLLQAPTLWIVALVGLVLGLLIAAGFYFRYRDLQQRHAELSEKLEESERNFQNAEELRQEQSNEIVRLSTSLEHERRHFKEQLASQIKARQELGDTFQALAARSLDSNNKRFMELARSELAKLNAVSQGELAKRQEAVKGLVEPIKESLEGFKRQVGELEKSRQSAYGQLSEQINGLMQAQDTLRNEAGNLVKALKKPEVRGRWGEIQLRRVVEMAGMLAYCDFTEQTTVNTEKGRLRPDMVVRLPGGQNLVVDSKAPLDAFTDAIQADDDAARAHHMTRHVRQIRARIRELGSKAYWNQFESSPEFVVLFIPGESFFSAALDQDGSLIEEGIRQNVILATPTTLISLLRAVAYGWRQEALAEGAKQISVLGKELYERLAVVADHVNNVGRHLGRSVDAYNKAVGSMESRVLSTARKFSELGVSSDRNIEELMQVESAPRDVESPELLSPDSSSKEV